MANRTYKIRHSVAGPGSRKVYRLTVPVDIAEVVPEGQEFVVELNDEGILYRVADAAKPAELPAWAKKKR